MVNTDLVELPARVGPASEASRIDTARAVAEVQARVIVAQQCPRDLVAAVKAMEQSCGQYALADVAFYRYPRGGKTVTGPTVKLMRELARCFRNVDHGIRELARFDGQSEYLAEAWDLESNVRSTRTIIIQHRRDTKDADGNAYIEELTSLRDIAEHNTSQASRQVRETIETILPPWFVQRAIDACHETLARGPKGTTKPLELRVSDAAKRFLDVYGVTEGQIEAKLGRPLAKFTPLDLSQLTVIFRSLQRGETNLDDEFPRDVATLDDLEPAPGELEAGQQPSDVEESAQLVQDPPVDEPEQDQPERPAELDVDWPEAAQPGSGGRRRRPPVP